MPNRLALAAMTAVLGACASAPPPSVPPQTLDDYRHGVARRIAAATGATDAPLPAMLKSVIVLEITVDSVGAPLEVSVFRSNGYSDLTHRAITAVIDASPFAAPAPALLQGDSVNFFETFLFRDDDSFQLRSLVGDAWKSSTTSPAASTD